MNSEDVKKYKAEYHLKNKQTIQERKKRYYLTNKNRLDEKSKLYNQCNKQQISEQRKTHYIQNKSILNQKSLLYYAQNKADNRANRAKRRAAQLERTPNWLSKSQKAEIKQIYRLAVDLSAKSGILHVVDHIVPLQGVEVSGLHVPWNLQILTQFENLSKGNKLTTSYRRDRFKYDLSVDKNSSNDNQSAQSSI